MRHPVTFTLVAASLSLAVFAGESQAAGQAKNVILMIADGQGFNSVRATELYTGAAAVQATDANFVKYAMQTYSASRPMPYDSAAMFNGSNATFGMSNYTDSSSAATAMYTGVKIYDGEVNWTTDNKPLTTFFEEAARAGRSIGAVTSVEFSHATPGAVYGHNSSRNNYAAIGSEGIYGSNPLDGSVGNSGSNPQAGNNGNYDSNNYYDHFTVLMGAGSGDYDDNGNVNTGKTDQYVGGSSAWTDIKNGAPNGWTLAQTKADFDAIADGTITAPTKLLGVAQVNTTLQQARSSALGVDANNPSGIKFNPNVPSLATMSRAALNVLAQNNGGFAVMIEGGAVDWANHANQIDRMLEEEIAFNNAVQAVVDWVDQGGDDVNWSNTLLIVTADHETGNLWGSGTYTDNNGNGSYDPSGDTFNGYQQITATGNAVLTGVQYLSGSHTNSLVPLYARGAGRELLAGMVIGTEDIASRYGVVGFTDGHGYIDNTSIHSLMLDASGVIPEPTSLGLLSVAGLLLLNRRRRHA